ncbi:MAG: hypothetical protein Q7T11_00215 [Deltaproteobacteria bacterium]|nr:hypothetical protein [Deltaproteobacteria bacterium]
MKRIFLIVLFLLSQILLPFVFAKCGGEDIPYDRGELSENEEEEDECDGDIFLTADCAEQADLSDEESDPADSAETQ